MPEYMDPAQDPNIDKAQMAMIAGHNRVNTNGIGIASKSVIASQR